MKALKPAEQNSPVYSRRDTRRRLSVFTLIAGCFCIAMLLCSGWQASAVSADPRVESTWLMIPGAGSEPSQEGKDYSKFSHQSSSHQRLPCLLCHRRENSAAVPVRSVQHTPCAGCHSEQFAARSGQICTICHTNVESRGRELKPFPKLRSFNMTFNHAKHRNVDCTTCHRPLNRGVALSMPAGTQAHTTCYRCHEPRAKANGRDISSCGECHKPGKYSRASTSAKAFRVSFSHDQHKDEGLSCLNCHKITGRTGRLQVSSPLPTQHPASNRVKSCETCHNDKQAFGIANFSDCKRCHKGPTFRF